jgi:alpha-tubulin suppressor-like RCC1 family protein
MPAQPTRARFSRSFLPAILALAMSACRDDSPTAPAAAPDLAVTSAPLSFRQVSVGWQHTCGVTTGNVAYCWGDNLGGQLGDGTRTRRLRPVKVAGGLRFLEIRPGTSHTCGVTTDSLAYCWGSSEYGALGEGTTYDYKLTPQRVAGGHRWRQVSAGNEYSCGVTTGSVAYCWGNNRWGRLGILSGGATTPAKVAGNLKFRRVNTAFSHTCGTTTNDRGYCWGYGWGDTPAAVPGGLGFRQVLPGSGFIPSSGENPSPDWIYSCGLTTLDRLYCDFGSQRAPTTAIDPTRHWLYVNPGAFHTCGLTRAGGAFCWGSNQEGALGLGSAIYSTSTPTRVASGLTFSGLSASVIGFYTCGVTTDHRAYCWGDNASGQLGVGTQYDDRFTPVAVLGPS